jgi:hypothetical protein
MPNVASPQVVISLQLLGLCHRLALGLKIKN